MDLFKLVIILITVLFIGFFSFDKVNAHSLDENKTDYDVVVYGATPAGISAAVYAAKEGASVALIEETDFIGGLPASGITNIDFKSFESLSGAWLEFANRIIQHYENVYGKDSEQVKASWKGGYFEPIVAQKVFQEMLIEQKDNLSIILEHRIVSGYTKNLNGRTTKLESIRILDLKTDFLKDIKAKVFIDCSYEGDLIKVAGVEYVVGSEGPEKYNEPSAVPKDWHVQCYNFRIVLSRDPNNRMPIPKPKNYNAENYNILLKGMEEGWITSLENKIVRGPLREGPNMKANFNDRKGAIQSIKLCNETDVWPEGSPEVRKMVWEKAKDHAQGLLYFLQNDERVLPDIRAEMNEWGLPKDEFKKYNHWPPLIYVREGRRMVGVYVMVEQDGKPEQGSFRAPAKKSAIAMGDYSWNGHGTHYTCDCSKVGGRELYGNLYSATVPWQVPYEAILPQSVNGLLAPVPASASRVAYGGVRQEPTWAIMGQAAGIAAVQAIKDSVEVRDIDIDRLQVTLHKYGIKTFYASDVEANSKYFRAIQYLGNRGLFQDLYDPRQVPQKGLEKLGPMVQWTTAYPYHDIQPDKKMEKELAEKWMQKLEIVDEKLLKQANKMIRGEFLNELYEIEYSN